MARIIILLFGSLLSTAVFAQLDAARDADVAYGHHHINITDSDAQRRFWVEGLGGCVASLGEAMQQWYFEHFSGELGTRIGQPAIAFLTDPWGTYIELTEGLDADL